MKFRDGRLSEEYQNIPLQLGKAVHFYKSMLNRYSTNIGGNLLNSSTSFID